MDRLPITRFLLILICLSVVGLPAAAQDTDPFRTLSAPVVGATGGMSSPETLPGLQASEGDEILRHRDFTGKPCLAVSGFARAYAIDSNLYDDVIKVTNSCPQRIAVKVCYYQSEDCIPIEVAGGESKEGVLGTQPSSPDFRFEFREKF